MKSKLQGMTFVEKLGYFWEYYKFHMLFAVLVGALLIMLLAPSEREYLYIGWLVPDTQYNTLEEAGEKLAHIVGNPSRDVVVFTSYARPANLVPNAAMQQRFTAMLRMGAIDLFATPRRGVVEMAEQGMLRPMHSVMRELYLLNPELYHRVQPYLLTISYTFEDEPQTTDIYAIRVGHTAFFRNLNERDVYLTSVFNTAKFYESAKALEAIFLWEP